MNRRKFFAGLAALVTAPLALARPHRHRLYGDGVHDDTQAMQALFDGQRVVMPDGWIQQASRGCPIVLGCGSYRLTQALDVRDGNYVIGGHLVQSNPETPVLQLSDGVEATFAHCYFEGPDDQCLTASGAMP